MNEKQKAYLVILGTFIIILGSIWSTSYLQKQREIEAWAFYGNMKYLSVDFDPGPGQPIMYSDIYILPTPKNYPLVISQLMTFSMEYEGCTFLMPDGSQESLWVKVK